LVLSFWTPAQGIFVKPKFLQDVRVFLRILVHFIPVGATNDVIRMHVVAHACVVVGSILFCAWVFWDFSRSRQAIRPLMMITRFLMDLMPFLLIFPVCRVSGMCLSLAMSGSGVHYVLFFVETILAILCVSFFYISWTLIGSSPYRPSTIVTAFDIGPFVEHFILNSVIFDISFFISLFVGWLDYLFMFLHFLIGIRLVRLYRRRLFDDASLNIIGLGSAIHGMLMDIVNAAARVIDTQDGLFYVILIFGFYALSMLGSGISYF
jgi:hypothetical protein